VKPFNFVSLSAIFHAALLLALAAIPALKLLPEQSGDQIEISTEVSNAPAPAAASAPPAVAPAPAPTPTPEPVAKIEPVAKAKPLPAPKPAPVEIVKDEPLPEPPVAAAALIDASDSEPQLEQDVAAADAAAQEFAEKQNLEVIDSAPAKPLEDEIVNETVEAAATQAVNTKKFQEPALPPPMVPPAKEELKNLAGADSGPGDGPPGGRAGRSNLDLKQVNGNIPPRYPVEARRSGRQGKVILNYYVTEDGLVKDVRIIQSSGHADLDREAVRAIGRYRYVRGQAGWTEHPVEFSLRGDFAPSPSRLRTAGPEKSEG